MRGRIIFGTMSRRVAFEGASRYWIQDAIHLSPHYDSIWFHGQQLTSSRDLVLLEKPKTTSGYKMPDKPPYPGRPAQPPGPTFLEYSPDGRRLIVAGTATFARSFRTNDNGEPDLLHSTQGETLAVASGVGTDTSFSQLFSLIPRRTTTSFLGLKTARCANMWSRQAI